MNNLSDQSREWLNTYYPVKAIEMQDRSDEDCINHSILKWQGLTRIEDYGLLINYYFKELREVSGDQFVLRINGNTCALCVKHYIENSDYPSGTCITCPLYRSLGKACDEGVDDLFTRSIKSPELMVAALEKTKWFVRYD